MGQVNYSQRVGNAYGYLGNHDAVYVGSTDFPVYSTVTPSNNLLYVPNANQGCRNFRVAGLDGSDVDVCYEYLQDGALGRLDMGAAKDVDADVMEAAGKVVPSTVKIEVKGAKGQAWSGSGYILSNDVIANNFPGVEIEENSYYIMTNHHVASGSKTLTVISADRKHKFSAEIVKRNGVELMDEMADCALIKIKTDVKLQRAEIASYSDLRQGETLITAGHPLGLPNVSITKGIASSIRQETGEPYLAIQTDAEINPGNSGGPLFTLDGKIVGTNTYSFKDTNGLSFAISTVEQLGVMSKIWGEGKISRGDIGLSFKPLDSSARYASGIPNDTTGAVIASVEPGSLADQSGIKRGDILTSIDILDEFGSVVRSINVNYEYSFDLTSLQREIYSLSPNSNVRLNILRKEVRENGAYSFYNFDAHLLVSEHGISKSADATSWGFTAIDDDNGVVLLDVIPDSATDEQGVEPATWIITGIKAKGLQRFSTQTVKNAEHLQEMLNWLDECGETEMTVYLRDYTDPSKVKRVTIRRGIDDALFAVMFNGENNLHYQS